MTEDVLRLGIDSRGMQSGERIARRSLKDIKRDAVKASDAVDGTESAFGRVTTPFHFVEPLPARF